MDEVIIDDPDIIINNFNYFFTNVGTKLAQTHKETDFNTISKFLSKRVDSSMYVSYDKPISGRVDRASATEAVDTGSIPGRVKPKTIKIGIHSFPA